MFSVKLGSVGGAVLLALASLAASAQTQTPPSATTGSTDSSGAAQNGTTSGPASGTPTTLGTGGTTTATPHQQEGVKDQSSSVTREVEQGAGAGSTQEPKGPAAEQPGSEGSKAGPAPKRGGSTE